MNIVRSMHCFFFNHSYSMKDCDKLIEHFLSPFPVIVTCSYCGRRMKVRLAKNRRMTLVRGKLFMIFIDVHDLFNVLIHGPPDDEIEMSFYDEMDDDDIS